MGKSNDEGSLRLRSRSRFSYEVAVRAVADLLMLNAAMVLGLATCILLSVNTIKNDQLVDTFQAHLRLQLFWSWLTGAIALGIFYACGFYTKGRAYRGRYRALIVSQAVALVFLIFGFLSLMAKEDDRITRGTLILSAIYALVLIVGSRIWSSLWKKIAYSEGATGRRAPAPEKARRVLVIGGAGYVGSALLRKLLAKGYEVRLLDMFMYGEEPIADMIGHRRLEIVKSDFRQIDKVVEAVYGMDAVIHIGAIVGDPACALDEDFTIEVNLTATRMIAEVAKAQGISRFIFASTCSVYGASDELLDERSALKPVSLYARTKIACEKVLQTIATDTFRPTILRFGTVYGLSGRPRFDLVVNLLTAKAVVDSKITVFGSDQWRPFVHVEDTALSIVKVLESPISLVGNQVFNVGSDEQNRTLGQIGEMIRAQVPTSEIVSSGSDGDRRNYRVDFSKIRNRVGYKPEWTLEKGIAQVIEAFRTGEVVNYADARYSNVKFLTEEEGQKLLRTDNSWLRSLIHETSEKSTNGSIALK
jgi:nucleoside-diphosphate-sugar epimerase